MNKYIILLFALLLFACNNSNPDNNGNAQEGETVVEDNQPRQRVKISTSYGDMVFELFNETPQHRDNFIKLAKEGFYDSLMFHRIQKNFMIQGGDPDSRGKVNPEQQLGMGTPGYTIPAEINTKFIMRQGALVGFHDGVKKNPEKASNGSQFMIIHGQPLRDYQIQDVGQENGMQYSSEQIMLYEQYGGTPNMDGKYTIFGQLVEGIHVLNKIVEAKTFRMEDPLLPDRPVKDIRMIVEVIE